MVVHACNPSPGEVEAGGQEFRLPSAVYWVQSQHWLATWDRLRSGFSTRYGWALSILSSQPSEIWSTLGVMVGDLPSHQVDTLLDTIAFLNQPSETYSLCTVYAGPAQELQSLNVESLARVSGLSTAVIAQQHNPLEVCIHLSNPYWLKLQGFLFFYDIKNITSVLNHFLDRMEINNLITFYMLLISDWMQWWKMSTYVNTLLPGFVESHLRDY